LPSLVAVEQQSGGREVQEKQFAKRPWISSQSDTAKRVLRYPKSILIRSSLTSIDEVVLEGKVRREERGPPLKVEVRNLNNLAIHSTLHS